MSEEQSLEGLDEILDDTTLTLEERFDSLAQGIIMQAYDAITRVRTRGQKIDQEAEYQQEIYLKQFNIISSIYTKLKRTGRISGKQNEHFDEQLLQQIKNRKGSLADIIQTVPLPGDKPTEV